LQQYDAVILAGGVNSEELKKYAPFDSEALIVIGSYPMVYYVYRAVRASQRIRNIVIVGPRQSLREIFKKEENLYLTEPGGDSIDSLANGIRELSALGITDRVLVLPTDIPFITSEAIDDFLSRCEGQEADFFYSIVSKEVNEKRFPGVKRTYVKLKEGVFTGGNLFVVKSDRIASCITLAKQFVARRKNPLKLARLLGLGLVWKYLTGRLTIPDAEERFYKVVGIRGRAVISPFAEVGVDVDKPSDLWLAERILGVSRP